MTTGWTELGREIDLSDIHWYIGEPVAGEPEPYGSGAAAYTDLATHVAEIGTVFDRYTGSDNPQFKGEAARAFNGLAETVREQLTLIPGIAEGVAAVLTDHEAGLKSLQADADAALVRARARWHRYEAAKTELRAAENALEAQAVDLLAPTDDSRHRNAEDELAEARSLVFRSRDEAQDLIDAESTLETTTADGIRGIDLGDMADPGFWDKLGGALWDVVLTIPIVGDVIELAHAISEGDWTRAIWRLRDLLDDILLVAAIVVVVLAVTFTGGAALALLAIAATKLVIDIGLYATGSEDPDNPGRTIGKFDLALSALAVVGAGAGVRAAAQPGLFRVGNSARTFGPGPGGLHRLPGVSNIHRIATASPTASNAAGSADAWVTATYGSFSTGYQLGSRWAGPSETVQRTRLLDAAVDAQIDALESGAELDEVFAWPPPPISPPTGTIPHTTPEAVDGATPEPTRTPTPNPNPTPTTEPPSTTPTATPPQPTTTSGP
ncbi:MAG: hypothetical protein AAGE88_03360 [Actinomycetota bacterium]